ncbi:cold-shock protein [Azospirillum agricola]|uniref:cold-shock protein n=1 Tax=Azospirillum agricola TaxID=1720247 RepID=UPI000A0F15C6|nr:cold shock domain-containing protein [Azospirillum agricola]MBP2230858.1 CspA family cold shock protein [Azospirillum agricola]SMH29373.1 cold-shock DNA-binding protein family [Azospirillum lipoferum]
MSEELKNVTATVKWFKPEKGFGFVRLADGSGEAFLHASVLAAASLPNPMEGTTLVCDMAQGAKGPQVVAIHSVTPPEAPPAPRARAPRPPRGGAPTAAETGEAPAPRAPKPPRERRERPPAEPAGPAVMAYGTVRWYNLDSQSGLIEPWEDGADVFFDRATLRLSGLDIVADGEDVRYLAVGSEDAPVAQRVELI